MSVGFIQGLFDHGDELNQVIQAKIAERQQLISSEFKRDRQSGEIGSAAGANLHGHFVNRKFFRGGGVVTFRTCTW